MNLSIQATYPLKGQTVVISDGGFTLRIYVTIGECGCPIGSGGRFRPERFKIFAEILSDDTLLQTIDMTFSGRASEFIGPVAPLPAGRFIVRIRAYDPETGASGNTSWVFTVSPPLSIPTKDTKGGADAVLDH